MRSTVTRRGVVFTPTAFRIIAAFRFGQVLLTMKMTATRVLFVLSFILMIGLMLQQCWQSKTPSEKWLYFFGDAARDFAGNALGPGRGSDLPVPEALGGTQVVVHENHVTFSPNQAPDLVLAFSPSGPPPPDESPDRVWKPLGDGWFALE
jgi:hypothetical protein